MSYVIFAAGLLLAVCGAASISFGYGIINVERGWASVIGGASALSGGLVTMALALILHSLSRLRALIRAQGESARAARPAAAAEASVDPSAQSPAKEAPAAESAIAVIAPSQAYADEEHVTLVVQGPARAPAAVAAPAVRQPPSPEPGPAAPEPGGVQASIEDIRRVVAETIKGKRLETLAAEAGPGAAAEPAAAKPGVKPAPSAGAELPPRRRAPPLSFHLPRAVGLTDLALQGSPDAQTIVASPLAEIQSEARGPTPDEAAGAGGEPFAPPAQDRARKDPPVVLGRYESEGTTYVMFSDGSIEARSKRGAYRFNSMAELKSFMDAQAHGEA